MAPLSREFSLPSSVFEDEETTTSIHNDATTVIASNKAASTSMDIYYDARDECESSSSSPSSSPHQTPLSVSFSDRHPIVIRNIVYCNSQAEFASYNKPNRWYSRKELKQFKEDALQIACLLDVHPTIFESEHTAVGLEGKTLTGMTRKKTGRLVAQSSVFELQRRQKARQGFVSDCEAIAAAYANYAMDARNAALERAAQLHAHESSSNQVGDRRFYRSSTKLTQPKSKTSKSTNMMFASPDNNEVFLYEAPAAQGTKKRSSVVTASRRSSLPRQRKARNNSIIVEKRAITGKRGSIGNRRSNSNSNKPHRLLSIIFGLSDRVGCLGVQKERYATTSMDFGSQVLSSTKPSMTAIEI